MSQLTIVLIIGDVVKVLSCGFYPYSDIKVLFCTVNFFVKTCFRLYVFNYFKTQIWKSKHMSSSMFDESVKYQKGVW